VLAIKKERRARSNRVAIHTILPAGSDRGRQRRGGEDAAPLARDRGRRLPPAAERARSPRRMAGARELGKIAMRRRGARFGFRGPVLRHMEAEDRVAAGELGTSGNELRLRLNKTRGRNQRAAASRPSQQ
jgi:hypothetical protein